MFTYTVDITISYSVFSVLFYVLVIRVYLNTLHDTLIYEFKWLKLLPKEAQVAMPGLKRNKSHAGNRYQNLPKKWQ
jgi:hypothetical protein